MTRRRKGSKTTITPLSLIIAIGVLVYLLVSSGALDDKPVNAPATTETTVPQASADGQASRGHEATTVPSAMSADDEAMLMVRDNGSLPSQRLTRKAYIVSYNKRTRCPNWVAWKLTADHTDGPVNRKDYGFHEDMDVPAPRAYRSDYTRNGIGMQRGHMCPAGDNKWDAQAMDECHLMTNICPQYGSLNGGDWKVLEEACRDWANAYGSVYIVCGPLFTSRKLVTIGYDEVAVPDGFFKVVLHLGKHPAAVAFVYPNSDCSGSMADYAMTVDDVERSTGFDFFSALPDETEKVVESKRSLTLSR